MNGLSQTLWPKHCVQGTIGAEITKELDQERIEAIFRSGMDKDIDITVAFLTMEGSNRQVWEII